MKYFLFIKNYSLSQDAAFITKGDFISNPTAAQQVKWHSVFGGESFNCLESVVMIMTFFFFPPSCRSKQTVLRQTETGGSKDCGFKCSAF